MWRIIGTVKKSGLAWNGWNSISREHLLEHELFKIIIILCYQSNLENENILWIGLQSTKTYLGK